MTRKKYADKKWTYVLHFNKRISPDHTTQHYVGSTDNLGRRVKNHRQGRGARLTEVAKERGISFKIGGLFSRDNISESDLKKQKNTRRFCDHCNDEGAF